MHNQMDTKIARGDRGVSEVKREPAVANSDCVLLELTEGSVCVCEEDGGSRQRRGWGGL